MSDKICQYEKYGICKLKKECPNYHPTLVCDDEKCTIKQCRKRHPVTCRYASVGVCQFGNSCKFDHRIMDDLKSHKDKIIQMERDFKLKIDDLEKKYKKVTTQCDDLKKENSQISALCGHQGNVIELLKAQVNEKFVTVETEMLNKFLTVKTEMLNSLKSEMHKHDIAEKCTRTHDSKRKRKSNDSLLKKSKSEDNISNIIEEIPAKKNKPLIDQEKRMERHMKAINEMSNIQELETEIDKIKNFVTKERMVPAKIIETKQKLKDLRQDMKKKIGTNKNEILVFGIFERMIEDINKINMNFKTNAKNHIEGFQKNCKIEKEKSLNTETELFENEIKLLNANE